MRRITLFELIPTERLSKKIKLLEFRENSKITPRLRGLKPATRLRWSRVISMKFVLSQCQTEDGSYIYGLNRVLVTSRWIFCCLPPSLLRIDRQMHAL